MYNVLLVEDEADIQFANKVLLERRGGYNVRLAMNLAQARRSIEEAVPDIIVLDIMLPDGSGLDFLEGLRQGSRRIPVLLLTALSETSDELKGIQAGGDDYITKPYDNDILLARIEALLRRTQQVPQTITKGPLTLDLLSSCAFHSGENLMLTDKEFNLLLMLTQNEGQTLSPEYIYEKIWGQPLVGGKNVVQSAVKRFRQKIQPTGYDIKTVYGKGYVFEESTRPEI